MLTVSGRGFASRVCGSLVHAAGLGDLVCDTFDEYVDRAVALGRDRALLQGYKDRLAAGRERCTLFDTPLLVRKLEALYAGMWDDYRRGELPVPNLTNLALYHEIGCQEEPDALGFLSLAEYHERYRLALAYRDSTFTAARRWPAVAGPTKRAVIGRIANRRPPPPRGSAASASPAATHHPTVRARRFRYGVQHPIPPSARRSWRTRRLTPSTIRRSCDGKTRSPAMPTWIPFVPIYNAVRSFSMTSVERMFDLYKSVEYIVKAGVPGDIVECGVWRGGSMMLVAKTLQMLGDTSRGLWLYDTFEGHPKPSEDEVDLWGHRPIDDSAGECEARWKHRLGPGQHRGGGRQHGLNRLSGPE